jgi:tetratricopeptide (TPR) repeat protein
MSVSLKEINLVPYNKNYVERKEISTYLRDQIISADERGDFPLILIGGIPGTGKSTFAGHFSKEIGLPIWIGVGERSFQDEVAILGEIALILKDHYLKPDFYKYFIQNVETNVPGTFRTVTNRTLAKCLSEDNYVLCIDNFHNVDGKPEIIELITGIIKLTEANRAISKFKGIFLLSENTPKNFWGKSIEIQLEGFETEEQTEEMIKKGLKEVQLTKYQLNLLHEKTEGHPGVIDLFIMYLTLLNQKDQSVILSDLTAKLQEIHEIKKVRDFLMLRIDTKLTPAQKTILEMISQLRQPFNLVDARAIMNVYDKSIDYENMHELRVHYLLRQATDAEMGSGYFYVHRLLRDHYSVSLSADNRNKIHELAASYYDNLDDPLRAGEHCIKGGEQVRAARILTNEDRRDKIYSSGNIGLYVELLSSLADKQFRNHSDLLLSVYEKKGDALEVTSSYSRALESYRRALELCGNTDVVKKAEILRKLGWVLQRISKWDESIKIYLDGLDLLSATERDVSSQIEVGRLKTQLGHVYFKRLEYPRALEYCNDGIEILEKFFEDKSSNKYLSVGSYLAQGYLFRGLISNGQGNYTDALNNLENAMRLYEFDDDAHGMCQTNMYIATVYAAVDGDIVRAERHLEMALTESLRLSYLKITADCYRQKARLGQRVKNFDQAISDLKIAIDKQKGIEAVHDLAWSHNTLANLYYSIGDYSDAREEWMIAANLFKENESTNDIVAIEANLAFLAKLQGDFRLPRTTWEEGLRFAKSNDDIEWEMDASLSLLELDLFTETNNSKLKDRLAACKKKSDVRGFEKYKVRALYLENLYHLENNHLEKCLDIIEECCAESNSSFFDVYYPCLLQRVELNMLLRRAAQAKVSLDNAINYLADYQHRNLFKARLERAQSLYLVSQDVDKALLAGSESVRLFKVVGAPLFAAGTQYKLGRLLKEYNFKEPAEKMLRESLLFFDRIPLRARSDAIKRLLAE